MRVNGISWGIDAPIIGGRNHLLNATLGPFHLVKSEIRLG